MKGIVFYGNLSKAHLVLGCVQAVIETAAKDRTRAGPGARAVLERYIRELEQVEGDLVSLVNSARQEQDTPPLGSDEPDAGRDVHEM